ncbi:amidohydrolase family protein [Microbacterium sp. XT11]|uniref:amidohydrolase family protein n=1 Tax=Microbacterium sp. XT11 TaxID=367477 RepID=UPI0007430B7E|nr:hypothetical protein [Microbacterium sp. XT11]ALX65661.1 hypothetical protein AB663_000276 [Microbacterium sp. XT11]
MRAARFFDGERWRDGTLVDVDGRMLVRDEPPAPGTPRLDGVVVGGFTDHHVHLQLVDAALLAGSRLGRVIDLGGDPAVLLSYRDPRSLSEERSDETKRAARTAIAVEFAGAFLTPQGGYPSDRSWAPAGSVREIATAADAASAVAEMADAGASCIKVASNSTAGPVFDDDLFRAIVAAAGEQGLPVVAHAEGAGQAQRAARLGASTLAHAPFTERLTDDEIVEQAASVSWISTLAIHDSAAGAIAVDNVRRFLAAGGTVLYGTDMGNGPTPVNLNAVELDRLREAGLDGEALLRALTPADPRDPASVLLLLPDETSDPLDARPLEGAI